MPAEATSDTPVGALEALRHRNFALFWCGALVSSTGTWVQNVTVPFVVFGITSSATWVGVAAFAQLLPLALSSLVGGWLADRVRRRNILIVTQVLSGVVAGLLWLSWVSDQASLWVLLGLVAVGGTVAGITIPAWQAFVTELVPRRLLLNAITLNSAQFNAARAFGPAVGGVVLAQLGVAWAFALNAVSFVVVAAAVAAISVVGTHQRRTPGERGDGVWRGLVSSAGYVRRHRGLSTCVLAVGALGLLASPVNSLVVVFADAVFEVGRVRYGVLAAALGTGSVLAAPLVAGRGSCLLRSHLVGGALVVHAVALVAFALSPTYVVAVVWLVAAGAGYLAVAATLNTTLQLQVDDHRRAKVLALYITVFTVAIPAGALVQGALASVVGVRVVVAVAAALLVGVTAVLWFGGRLASLDGGDTAVTGAASRPSAPDAAQPQALDAPAGPHVPDAPVGPETPRNVGRQASSGS